MQVLNQKLLPEARMRPVDRRTLAILLVATLVGAAWATYNFASTGGARGEEQLRPLVWTIFATPFALFLGWVVARRYEAWLAAFVCFSLYFFTPFVAARIESLVLTPAEASATKHALYFQSAIVLHIIAAIVIALWRAMQPASTSDAALQDEESGSEGMGEGI